MPNREYGNNLELHPDDAEEIVRVPARFKESQPDPEFAPISCWDCGLDGYGTVCYVMEIEEATPMEWKAVLVCRDCAERDDPLCGLGPSDLDHKLVKDN